MKVLIEKTGVERADKMSSKLFERHSKEETGLNIRYGDLVRNDYGKPMAVGDYYFNISHSKNYWCLGIHNSKIGVDIEKRRSINERMRRRILSEGEDPYRGELLNTWVLKEAYVKMLGVGLSLDLRKILISDILKSCRIEDYSTDEYVCYAVCSGGKHAMI